MLARHDQLDSHIRVLTPENIGFEYRVASPFERVVAYLIDCIIMALIIGVVSISALLVFGAIGSLGLGAGVMLIVWFLVAWFYGGLFETFWNGQTPGKRSLGMRVLGVDGRPINAGQAVLRNFLRVVDGFPFILLFGIPWLPVPTSLVALVATSLNARYQRLGDLACGTMVVAEDRSRAAKFNEINDVILGPLEGLLPPSTAPSRSLARAISRYVDRRRYFGPARRAEIARHVGQVLVEHYNLPPGIDHDALLCALYQRTFLTPRSEELAMERPPLALSDET